MFWLHPADAAIRAKGGLARFRQFIMGGRKDPKSNTRYNEYGSQHLLTV